MMNNQLSNISIHSFKQKPLPPAQTHQNKTKIKNNKTLNKNENTQDKSLTFRITTLNVRGLNNKSKQTLLIDHMEEYNIQIMGVSETNLSEKTSKLIYDRNRIYHAYFAADDEQSRGAGVGIIITKQYNKYVRKCNSYKGRAVYIDLYIRGRQNIRIIQVYVNANLKERK